MRATMLKLLLLPILLIVAACGDEGGSDPTHAPADVISVVVSATGPTDIYFNQTEEIDITVRNDSTVSVYPPIRVLKDGVSLPRISIPTLAPNQAHLTTYSLWNGQDLDTIHTFVLSNDYGWSQTFTIHYHAATGG